MKPFKWQSRAKGYWGLYPNWAAGILASAVDDRRYESVVNSGAMYPDSSANPAIAKIM